MSEKVLIKRECLFENRKRKAVDRPNEKNGIGGFNRVFTVMRCEMFVYYRENHEIKILIFTLRLPVWCTVPYLLPVVVI